MANPTTGFGLRPIRRADGAALTFQLIPRRIAYNDNTTIGTGDLCKQVDTGYVTAYTAADATVAGVFWGCTYFSPTIGRTVWSPSWNAVAGLASTQIVTAYMIADPMIEFEIRASGTVTFPTDIGANFEVTVGTVNSLTGQSTTLLLASSIATTATLPLRLLGPSQRITGSFNDNSLTNSVCEVRLNTLNYLTVALGV